MYTIAEELTEKNWTAEQLATLATQVDVSVTYPRTSGTTRPTPADDRAHDVQWRQSALRDARRSARDNAGKPTAARYAAAAALAEIAFVNALRSAGVPSVAP